MRPAPRTPHAPAPHAPAPRAPAPRTPARRALFACLGLIAGLSACSNNEAVEAATGMADAICACKSVSCAREITEKYAEKVESHKDMRGTTEDGEKIKAAGLRVKDCISRLRAKEKDGA